MPETHEIPDKDFYRINEVCQYTDTQPYVLRFWESEFPQLGPGDGSGRRRVYSRKELDLVQRIKELLYDEEYTIAGARKKLQDESGGKRKPASRGKGRSKKDNVRKLEVAPAPRPVARVETPRLPLEVVDPRTISRERYETAVDEIEHLRLKLKEADKDVRQAEAALIDAEAAAEFHRTRAEQVATRIEGLLDTLT